MADPVSRSSAALAQLIQTVPEHALDKIESAVLQLGGARTDDLLRLIVERRRDLPRRTRFLSPLAPLFHPRSDGLSSLIFPAAVAPRLWDEVRQGEPILLPTLDHTDPGKQALVIQVCERLWIAASHVVRDHPDRIWPVDVEPETRDAGLVELASCCDLAGLVLHALPRLQIWVGRPGPEHRAELRLLIRDASLIAPDAGYRVMEILLTHLADAALVVRLIVNAAPSTADSEFIRGSEMGDLIQRLLDTCRDKAASLPWKAHRRLQTAFAAGPESDEIAACETLQWIVDVLSELDMTLQPATTDLWGKDIRAQKDALSVQLSRRLKTIDKIVTAALPMTRVATVGRMTRDVPDTGRALEPEQGAQVRQSLTLVVRTRSATLVLGLESLRSQLQIGLTESLANYANSLLDLINAEEAEAVNLTLDRTEALIVWLEDLEAKEEARIVRRRLSTAREYLGDADVPICVSPDDDG